MKDPLNDLDAEAYYDYLRNQSEEGFEIRFAGYETSHSINISVNNSIDTHPFGPVRELSVNIDNIDNTISNSSKMVNNKVIESRDVYHINTNLSKSLESTNENIGQSHNKDNKTLDQTLVRKKLEILDKFAKTVNVIPEKLLESQHGRNRTVLCTHYNNEGKEEFHRNRTVFRNIWKNLHSFSPKDVTLVTQLTLAKINVLEMVAKHWPGPISIAIHISADELKKTKSTFSKHQYLLSRKNIDVSVVLAKGVSNQPY